MRTILVILSALGAAILVLNFIKILQRKLAGHNHDSASGLVSVAHLISAGVGMLVFFLGAFWLESNSAPPGSVYAPATIQNGSVKSGGFETEAR